MKVAFCSNFLSEHQIPFCNELYKKLEGNFHFIAAQSMSAERLNMGFKNSNDLYPYVIKTYENGEQHNQALQICSDSDIVIIGSAPDYFIQSRIKQNKVTFRYCERYFKRGRWRILDPRVFISHYKKDFVYRNKNLYMLCASAYTAPDCRFILSYPNKTFKWGYFPPVAKHGVSALLEAKPKNTVKILWAARFIKLKHPEIPIELLKRLITNGFNVQLNMIGEGELLAQCKELAASLGIQDSVSFPGAMPPEQVQQQMKEANIFLFTSDRQEGWGAVLNESMANGCAVIADQRIGSVPFLIEDGVNGFAYNNNLTNDLYDKVVKLIEQPELRDRIGRNAYLTMQNIWCAEHASARLIQLFEGVLEGNIPEFNSGPCSRA